jgi:hypothetical protein
MPATPIPPPLPLRPGPNRADIPSHEAPFPVDPPTRYTPPAEPLGPGQVRIADCVGRAVKCPQCGEPAPVRPALKRMPDNLGAADPDFMRLDCRYCGAKLYIRSTPVSLS